MSRLADLEAQVQAAWMRGSRVAYGTDPEFSRDELRALLAVYADELQELGDPRGELVAHDLLRTPTTDDKARFEVLVGEWLGPFARHPNVNTKYGLIGVSVTDTEPTLLQEFLETRGAPYLSSVSIFGDVFTVRTTIATLARAVRPWLGTLRIVVPSTSGLSMATAVLPPDLAEQLIAATPALYALAIDARSLVRAFPHPALRRVSVESIEDLGTLFGLGDPLPAVTDLELRVEGQPALLPASHWPALVRLDLARSESPFRFFHALAIKQQLTHVRLPAPRTREDRDLLQAARAEMPALVALDMPPESPWHANVPAVVLAFADRELIADLQALVPVMERVYETLPVEARIVWDDFWALAGDGELPAGVLADALTACGPALVDEGWRTARDALGARPDVLVTMRPL
jgi:hypothetical protein